jgi:hypothetical protein
MQGRETYYLDTTGRLMSHENKMVDLLVHELFFGRQVFVYTKIEYAGLFLPTLKHESFQVWKLKRMDGDSAVVQCTDGNDKVLKVQQIDYTDS